MLVQDTVVRGQVEHCIQLLGRNHISVQEFKSLFTLLKDLPPGERPALLPCIIRILHNMMLPETRLAARSAAVGGLLVAPCAFFDFDGVSSGLHLPNLSGWPTTRGYTFTTWLRVEAFESPITRTHMGSAASPTSGRSSAPAVDLEAERAQAYSPRLYSFMTEEGYGFEAFFRGMAAHVCV